MYKVLFVEPTEYGHVMLHLSAFFSSDIWKKEQIYFLVPHSVKDRIISEKIVSHESAEEIFINSLSESGLIKKINHLYQILKLISLNSYTHVCFKYLDYHLFLTPIIKLFHPAIRISGIFFRPVLHYKSLHYPMNGITIIYWIKMIIKNYFLLFFLKIGIIKSCFFQDEGALRVYGQKRNNTFWLPTPVINDSLMENNDTDKKEITFLFFGQVAKRKGIYKILNVWSQLPDKYKEQVILNIVGKASDKDHFRIKKHIDELKNNGWRINYNNEFIPNNRIYSEYQRADFILSPHDLQFGSSGVAIQSIVWQKPILVHNMGWIGLFIGKNKFGISIDTNNLQLFKSVIMGLCNREINVRIEREAAVNLLNQNDRKLWSLQLYRGIVEFN